MDELRVRAFERGDEDAVWELLREAIAGGDAFVYDATALRADVLSDWIGAERSTFVAAGDDGIVLGAGFVRRNARWRGAHVANAGYVVSRAARGRGIARQLCEYSLGIARDAGFTAMQFNYVVSSNDSAVRAWTACGFAIVGRVPGAFRHATRGDVDILIMHRHL